ncbi:MAG: radical SAM protein [bacterium]
MAAKIDYDLKFQSFEKQELFARLNPDQQKFIKRLAFTHRFTFQEFREVVEICRDLFMWRESGLPSWWLSRERQFSSNGVAAKKQLLQALRAHVRELKHRPKAYPQNGLPKPQQRDKYKISTVQMDKKIHGMCPVASEDTVCCNLRTIDAVENCVFGCSYCTIQTFYSDEFVFDADFEKKLKAIQLDPQRFYHFGTGQASDSLSWGNRNGNLDALCRFAADNPNILLEFKTKSKNIDYFMQYRIPSNVVCSWSLNTPTIIQNEEHFTADLSERISAARSVREKGIKVAFHFHPMVYYEGWQQAYPQIATTLLQEFLPEEVLFLSFGSVTLIKPVINKIRKLGNATKTLQMEMVPDPHGKLTYPDDIKIALFKTMYQAFRPWHGKVFMYLCMEKAAIWQATFGFVYQTNDEFEQDFGQKVLLKLHK